VFTPTPHAGIASENIGDTCVLVFWEQRLAFLATPKTGSTAIAGALEPLAVLSVQRPPELKHTTVQRFHRFVGPYLEVASGGPFEVVALMREPKDWLGSWYRYRQREELGNPKRRTNNISFDQFVRAWCSDAPPEYADVGTQSYFLRPRKDKGLDRLFRYEEIDAFVHFLEDRLNCEITLPRLNVSPAAALDLAPETEAALRLKAVAEYALYDSLKSSGER
jgi:hypothetical protein